jgi:hypothetical protein
MMNKVALFTLLVLLLAACAKVGDGRYAEVPTPQRAGDKPQTINNQKDDFDGRSKPITYVELPDDVLKPRKLGVTQFPDVTVGPYELRSENLGSALQLILDDYDISIAFETEEALTRRITIIGLRGKLADVVERLCSAADLYCGLENDTLIVKEQGTFSVTMPPLGNTAFMDIASGISSITGKPPVIDNSTRTMTYRATDRTNFLVTQYFERLRLNTALIVFETYIWEVTLNNQSSFGIDWDNFNIRGDRLIGLPSPSADLAKLGYNFTYSEGGININSFIRFLSSQGAVKTISRPQISILSGGKATLKIGETTNYVRESTTTLSSSGDTASVTFTTDQLNTGLEIELTSAWDESTIYSDISIKQSTVLEIESRGSEDAGTFLQLPRTAERELTTQVRVRPGDSIMVAGLVTEDDTLGRQGIGTRQPIIPLNREESVRNRELVFILSPRVVIYKPRELLPATAIDIKDVVIPEENAPESIIDTPIDLLPTIQEIEDTPNEPSASNKAVIDNESVGIVVDKSNIESVTAETLAAPSLVEATETQENLGLRIPEDSLDETIPIVDRSIPPARRDDAPATPTMPSQTLRSQENQAIAEVEEAQKIPTNSAADKTDIFFLNENVPMVDRREAFPLDNNTQVSTPPPPSPSEAVQPPAQRLSTEPTETMGVIERDPLEQRSLLSSIQAMSDKLNVRVIPRPARNLPKTGVATKLELRGWEQ